RDFHVTGVQTCALPILRDLSELNRRLGGEAVDGLICHLAGLLRDRSPALPQGALAARVRGGEFVLLLPGLLGEEAEHLAEALLEDLAELHAATREEPLARLALVPFAGGDDLPTLMHLADEALAGSASPWLRLQRAGFDDTLEE